MDDDSPEIDLFAEDAEEEEEAWCPLVVRSGGSSTEPLVLMLPAARAQVWGSALNMSRWLAANPDVVAGR